MSSPDQSEMKQLRQALAAIPVEDIRDMLGFLQGAILLAYGMAMEQNRDTEWLFDWKVQFERVSTWLEAVKQVKQQQENSHGCN